MINICYAIYDPKDKYSKITGTSMLSLLENTKEDITFHLLHDNNISDIIFAGVKMKKYAWVR